MIRSPLFAGLLLVLLIAVLWFGLWPLYANVQSARGANKELERTITEEREATTRLEELVRRMEERKDDIAKLEAAIPESRDLAALIAVFEEAANINGLRLTAINFLKETADEDPAGEAGGSQVFAEAAAELELVGGYPALRTLLSDIERSFPLMDIRGMSFQPQDGDNPGSPYEITVQLETYHLR
jgi:Tfp pilus assembly protein PilO